MKQCPRCGEWNGENRDSCFRCGNGLPMSAGYQKLCPRCKLLYSPKAVSCEKCGGPLSVYRAEPAGSDSGGEELRWWMIAAAIIWPVVGIVGGLILKARGDDAGGGSLQFPSSPSPFLSGWDW